MHADHYNQLTKAYWAIFSLIYVCAILILAVGKYNFSISLIAHSVNAGAHLHLGHASL